MVEAYLIIQEFSGNNVDFVIGTKPFGIIWYNYEEAFERLQEILIDFENNKNKNVSKPKLVKITLHT